MAGIVSAKDVALLLEVFLMVDFSASVALPKHLKTSGTSLAARKRFGTATNHTTPATMTPKITSYDAEGSSLYSASELRRASVRSHTAAKWSSHLTGGLTQILQCVRTAQTHAAGYRGGPTGHAAAPISL